MKELGPPEVFYFQITTVLVHDLPFAYVYLCFNRAITLHVMCSALYYNGKSMFLI